MSLASTMCAIRICKGPTRGKPGSSMGAGTMLGIFLRVRSAPVGPPIPCCRSTSSCRKRGSPGAAGPFAGGGALGTGLVAEDTFRGRLPDHLGAHAVLHGQQSGNRGRRDRTSAEHPLREPLVLRGRGVCFPDPEDSRPASRRGQPESGGRGLRGHDLAEPRMGTRDAG